MASYRVLHPYQHTRDVNEVVNSIRAGRLNSGGTVSFATNTTATSLADPRAHPDVRLYLTPRNAPARGEAWWYAPTFGTVTIHHNTSSVIRTFGYDLIG